MGGADSEISDATTEVVVEMAWFERMPIAKSSRRLGLRSEASARFERGVDPFGIDLAQDRFVDLLGGVGGGSVTTVTKGLVDEQIGRAHVCTPVTNAHLVCRRLLENKTTTKNWRRTMKRL